MEGPQIRMYYATEIKFDAFLKKALELGADFVATGHYCRKESFTDNEGKEIFYTCRKRPKQRPKLFSLSAHTGAAVEVYVSYGAPA